MTKRKTTKKTTKRKKTSSNVLTYIAIALAIIATLLIALIGGYYIGFHDAETKSQKIIKQEKTKRVHLQEKQNSITKKLQDVLKKETKYNSAAHEIEDEELINPPKTKKTTYTKLFASKPKLAIIIDDVSRGSEVKAIKSLNIPITMSFFPPRPARPNSAKLAQKESFFMVHLPLEALHFTAEEPNTLRVSDSQEKILQRIAQIKQLFPRVRYINNHTGSKFTENEIAMNRLMVALEKYHIHFIDSRTTAKTVVPKVMKNFGLKYVARDMFLDHHSDENYILDQIKKAVKFAKSHGKAIAIGHPHKNTLKALYDAKRNGFFQDVDLVQVYQLY